MKINKKTEGERLTIAVDGKIDTATAPILSKELEGLLDGVKELVFDFAQCEYISSAGLRVLIMAQKIMSKKGSMVVKNPNDIVRDIFHVTNLSKMTTID